MLAADHLIGLIVGASASLIAAPFADRIFELLAMTDDSLTLPAIALAPCNVSENYTATPSVTAKRRVSKPS